MCSMKLKKVNRFFCRHRNHIVIMGLFCVCLFLSVKMSSIHVFPFLPPGIKRLFLRPADGSIWMEIGEYINNLGMAYIASILTYLVVQYIPGRQKAKKTFHLFENSFVALYMHMSELIGMYLFEIEKEKLKENEVTVEDLKEINSVVLIDQEKWVRILDYRNGIRGNTVSHSYNLYTDVKNNTALIIDEIKKIKNSPSAVFLDEDVVEIISKIESCRFLEMISYWSQPYIAIPSYEPIVIHQDINFYEFIQFHLELNQYIFDKITYRYERMDEQEIEREKNRQAFRIGRGVIRFLTMEDIENGIKRIISLEPEEKTLNKAEGVLLELLVSYDNGIKREMRILEIAKLLAEYIHKNQKNEHDRGYSYCNLIQVKIRMHCTLTEEEICRLRKYEQSQDDKSLALGSAILLRNFQGANNIFDTMAEDERLLFTELPIYSLWEEPPIPCCKSPRLFID